MQCSDPASYSYRTECSDNPGSGPDRPSTRYHHSDYPPSANKLWNWTVTYSRSLDRSQPYNKPPVLTALSSDLSSRLATNRSHTTDFPWAHCWRTYFLP